jgi:hypothetical protein
MCLPLLSPHSSRGLSACGSRRRVWPQEAGGQHTMLAASSGEEDEGRGAAGRPPAGRVASESGTSDGRGRSPNRRPGGWPSEDGAGHGGDRARRAARDAREAFRRIGSVAREAAQVMGVTELEESDDDDRML